MTSDFAIHRTGLIMHMIRHMHAWTDSHMHAAQRSKPSEHTVRLCRMRWSHVHARGNRHSGATIAHNFSEGKYHRYLELTYIVDMPSSTDCSPALASSSVDVEACLTENHDVRPVRRPTRVVQKKSYKFLQPMAGSKKRNSIVFPRLLFFIRLQCPYTLLHF